MAKLNRIGCLDIRGKIRTRMMLERTTYFSYQVIKLEDVLYGLRNESDHEADQRANVVNFQD